MRNALSSYVLVGLMAFGAGGCSSGGGDDSSSSLHITCGGGEKFCIISCDIGCSQTGCSVTEIAENQKLHFKFSDEVMASSVNSASVSIRTATGVAPDGELLVAKTEVVFVPRVSTINGISSFGFQRNQSYIVTIAGGSTASQGVRNLSGARLDHELSCTVIASRGIVDEDQQSPTVEMLSPTNLLAAPLNPTIVLRFSELIDTTPLQGSLNEGSPIRVLLRGTTPAGECDGDADGVALEGVPALSTEVVSGRAVTVVTFQPTVQLPSRSCVTVEVTADLRDLSGRQATPAAFQFITEQGVSVPITVTETFANATGQNPLVSGGIWGGAAGSGARPGLIGGDGRHGSFDITLGTPVGGGVYEWNTGDFTIPATSSLTGLQYHITDGKFYFTDFVLPEGTTLRWKGTSTPVVYVRGRGEVRGKIDVSADDLPFTTTPFGPASGQRVSSFNARTPLVATPWPGQVGGAAYCGGGRGGNGGAKCLSAGPFPLANGQPGVDVFVNAGHAYAGQVTGTGGRGSALWPASGLRDDTLPIASLYRRFFSTGGTGGGFGLAGALSTATLTGASLSGSPLGGLSFPLAYPVTPPPNYTSLNHYTIGGSGGGGGGSHSFGTFTFTGDEFMAGSAGSGGGGAMALRVGGDLLVASTAELVSKGGLGVVINGDNVANNVATGPQFGYDTAWGVSSPGGGGSGGSFLLQAGKDLSVSGSINTSGGPGSRAGYYVLNPSGLNIQAQAGAGSSGFFRLEAGGTVGFSGTSTPTYSAAVNTGVLNDRDDASGDISTWRTTNQFFPPMWLRYELDVDLFGNGSSVITYTDSGAVGTLKANDPNGAVMIQFQGANLNQAGNEPLPGTVGVWREGIGAGAGPGISLDSVTGFRFGLTYNRGLFPNVVVRALRVYAQT